MIVKTLEDVRGTKGDMHTKNWSSVRFLHAEDGMGYSVTDTHLHPGCDLVIEYKNHLEACYCIEGEGSIEDLKVGKVHRLLPGTIYVLDKHDRHRLRSTNGCRIICTFAPALSGGEVHRADGSYAPAPASGKASAKAAKRKRAAGKAKAKIKSRAKARPRVAAKKRARR